MEFYNLILFAFAVLAFFVLVFFSSVGAVEMGGIIGVVILMGGASIAVNFAFSVKLWDKLKCIEEKVEEAKGE